MRISHVMVAKGFGGAERWFVDLARALADAGHAVQTIHHRDFARPELLDGNPPIVRSRVQVHGAWDIVARRGIRRALTGFGPEVLHAHLARGAHLAGKLGHDLGLPVVATLHNYVDLKYYRYVDAFVATTPDQRDYLLAAGIGAERVALIPHFSLLAPQPREPRRSATPVVLAYGRMVPKKGFDVLLYAFRALVGAGSPAVLRLGGDGPERARLEQLTDELGLRDRVRYEGWIDDVGAALAEADLFVLPSRDEPFGIAVLEAMAAGVPVVATRTQGPLIMLDESVAWLAEVGDAESLGTAMGAALADPEAAGRRAAAARERYRERFSAEAVVPQYERLYASLCGRDRR